MTSGGVVVLVTNCDQMITEQQFAADLCHDSRSWTQALLHLFSIFMFILNGPAL
jgi:hypothetical protein